VIIETPQHIKSIADLDEDQIGKVINAHIIRMNDLKKDPRLKYALVFKNYGYQAGSSVIPHSRSQLIATPVTPKRIKEELAGAMNYFYYRNRCIFCDLLRFELKDEKRIVLDMNGFVALAPYASRFPFEIWIMPKSHSCDFPDMDAENIRHLASVFKAVFMKLKKGVNDPPFNLVVHTAPFRKTKKGGYWTTIEEDYHWHIEIIPRLSGVAGFEWGTGAYINTMPPEDAAQYLREVKI
jgi:UDPglucose--hexose-1-phosphate uridylyltransferase